MDQIQISTIDSFCRKLLTTMPFSNPLGLSGVMESDEDKLAKDFFDRSRRSNTSAFRDVETRYVLKTKSLQNAFVSCCGKGDFTPVYPPQNDQTMKTIESAELPQKAWEMLEKFRGLLKDLPFLTKMLYPELSALLARPKAVFAANANGLQELIVFYRKHPTIIGAEYNSLVSEDLLSVYLDSYDAFMTEMFGTDDNMRKKPKTLPLAQCQAALDGLARLFQRQARHVEWVAPELVSLVKAYQGTIFSEDAGSAGCTCCISTSAAQRRSAIFPAAPLSRRSPRMIQTSRRRRKKDTPCSPGLRIRRSMRT